LRVGGHVDPSLEAILSLRPDLVIVETANRETRNAVAALGLPFLEIDHRRLDGILDSTLSIGEACGVADHAERLHADLTARMASVREIADRDPSRALVIVGRDVSTGRLRDLYAAGPGTFLGQILEAAGGENPLPSGEIGYPVLSREAVLRLDPEVVFELAPELAGDPDGRVRLGAAWGELSDVAAVRAGRVHILLDQRLLVPGPHFVDILETFASYLYPADGSDR